MFELPLNAELYASDHHGIYIPQYFAESIQREYLGGVSDEDMQILLDGPESEYYWDAWDMVLNNAVLTDKSGKRWTLWQDGDLWIVPEDWMPED
jgi:hypothetical protein